MQAEITYEVRAKEMEESDWGRGYTERTLWRITVINGKKMKDEVQVAKFHSNAEADIFEEWLKTK